VFHTCKISVHRPVVTEVSRSFSLLLKTSKFATGVSLHIFDVLSFTILNQFDNCLVETESLSRQGNKGMSPHDIKIDMNRCSLLSRITASAGNCCTADLTAVNSLLCFC
jgi:hypothetical protein